VVPSNDLEAKAILGLLKSADETAWVTAQPWGASWEKLEPEIQDKLRALPSPARIIGIELAGSNPYGARNIDHHSYAAEDRWRPESSIEQVAAELGVSLNRWQRLVAANDRGYIAELRLVGASVEEIEAIRAADRRAQGLTEADERQAEDDVRTAVCVRPGSCFVACSRPTSAHLDALAQSAAEVLLAGDDEWLYSGPRFHELAEMRWEQPNWSGGQHENGYFGINQPDEIAKTTIRSWFGPPCLT